MAAGLSACGGAGDLVTIPDPCALLSGNTLGAVVGARFDAPRAGKSLGGDASRARYASCSWRSQSQVGTGGVRESVQVKLTVWRWPNGADGALGYVRAMEEAARASSLRSARVESLGDRAFWDGTLHVASGDLSFSMAVRPERGAFSDVRDRTLEQKLARVVLGRL